MEIIIDSPLSQLKCGVLHHWDFNLTYSIWKKKTTLLLFFFPKIEIKIVLCFCSNKKKKVCFCFEFDLFGPSNRLAHDSNFQGWLNIYWIVLRCLLCSCTMKHITVICLKQLLLFLNFKRNNKYSERLFWFFKYLCKNIYEMCHFNVLLKTHISYSDICCLEESLLFTIL